MWRGFYRRLRSVLFPRDTERDIKDEIATHVEFQIRKYLAGGMDEQQARRRARLDFGGIEAVREECLEVERLAWVDAATRNLKHCFRSLRRSPGFTFVFLLILTVSLAANVCVFSIIDGIFLRALPLPHPEELLRISEVGKKNDLLGIPSTGLEILKSNPTLQDVCGFDTSLSGVGINGNVRSIGVAGFTGDCFRTLGLQLQAGRSITRTDDVMGSAGMAVISDALWRSDFGGRADVLGKTLEISGQLYTIAGVTQRGFRGLLLGFPQDIMIPLEQRPDVLLNGKKQTWYWVSILARRAHNVSEAKARASVLAQRKQLLQETIPRQYNAAERSDYLARAIVVLSGQSGIDYFLRRRFGEPLLAIFAICAAMLLIACVNLTSLLLARSLNRRREVAVRLALGGKRGHIAALFLLESALLVVVGIVTGAFGGLWLARAILAYGDPIFSNFHLVVGLDARVLGYLGLLLLLILGCFGLTSLWQSSRLASADALKNSGRGVIATSNTAQRVLIGVQIALTLAFVAQSVLLQASVRNMYRIDFGIDPNNLWEVELEELHKGFPPARHYRDLLRQVETLPEIESATITGVIPFLNYDYREPVALVEDAPKNGEVQAREISAGDNYFSTLGARIVAGNDFRRDDSPDQEPTVVISRSLARHWGDPASLSGRHLRLGHEAAYQQLKIVGIASDMDLNLENLDDTKPFAVYVNLWQHRDLQGYPVLLIRTKGGALPSAAIREIVAQNGYEYVQRQTTIGSEIDNALVENRALASLAGVFAVLALGLAASGLFGLLSYQVTNRAGEIGIRIALGALPAQIARLIARQIAEVFLCGTVAGLALAFIAGRLMTSFFYGVSGYQSSAPLLATLVLALTAAIAAWLPIRRATAMDPLAALRHE
jgi:predicted permease